MKPLIVFTGGHHNSALVVAQALKKEGYLIAWIGRKFGSGGDKSVSAEYQEVTKSNIPFYELKTGKFYRQKNPLEFIKIILGFFESFAYLLKLRPALIVSFGGYLAVPVVICGWLLQIRSVTHEQTVTAGWANKIISNFANKILLTHQSSLKNFPKDKSVVVGLPVKNELFLKSLKKSYKPPLLYIVCGKQGSHLINQAIFPLIPALVKKFTIIHQIGSNTVYKDIDKARRVKEGLGSLSSRYHFEPYFFAKEAASNLQSAKVVISRAGAHITYELMLLQKRTIFIPISWVSHNEQFLNATTAIKYLPGIILEEKDLNSQNLSQAIDSVLLAKEKPISNLPNNAIEKTVNEVKKLLHS